MDWVDGIDAEGVVVVERSTAKAVARLGAIGPDIEVLIERARLIAAAPEMVEALALLLAAQDVQEADKALRAARAALRKAERAP